MHQCISAVLYIVFFFRLGANFIVCLVIGTWVSSRKHFVCLVVSFRYNGLDMLALVTFGRVRALGARCGPFGPAMR